MATASEIALLGAEKRHWRGIGRIKHLLGEQAWYRTDVVYDSLPTELHQTTEFRLGYSRHFEPEFETVSTVCGQVYDDPRLIDLWNEDTDPGQIVHMFCQRCQAINPSGFDGVQYSREHQSEIGGLLPRDLGKQLQVKINTASDQRRINSSEDIRTLADREIRAAIHAAASSRPSEKFDIDRLVGIKGLTDQQRALATSRLEPAIVRSAIFRSVLDWSSLYLPDKKIDPGRSCETIATIMSTADTHLMHFTNS